MRQRRLLQPRVLREEAVARLHRKVARGAAKSVLQVLFAAPSRGQWRVSRKLPGYLSLSVALIAEANYFWHSRKCSLGVIAAGQAR
jgi:hypothetical protein